ncbi:MAG: hypothetical protein ACRCY8_13410 [Dermatophilaceae bacterium]
MIGTTPLLELGGGHYRWSELAAAQSEPTEWSHSGATVDGDDGLWFTDGSGSTLIRVATDGGVSRVTVPTTECHGLAALSGGEMWIADPGLKSVPRDGEYVQADTPGAVIRVDAGGGVIQRLEEPGGRAWRPTAVAVDGLGRDSDGRVWVGDGYGESLVHGFSASGEAEWTVDGSATGVPFSTPHGLFVDRRGPTPRLLVADRGRRRIVSLGLDGTLLGVFGEGVLTSPSSLAVHDDLLWVTELHGGLAVFGADDTLISTIPTPVDFPPDSFPNAEVDGALVPAPRTPGRFGSPHGIAVRRTGEVLVTEWGIGGRVVLLEPVSEVQPGR